MGTVNDILRHKSGFSLYSIAIGEPAFKALEKMLEKSIGSLLVMNKEKLLGIVTERDYLEHVSMKQLTGKEITVGEIMTPNVISVNLLTTIDQCRRIMTEMRIRHLPVVENKNVIGVVSMGDIVSYVVSDQEFQISQLTQYISGSLTVSTAI
jgi:CBS domain-containing protein